MQEISHKDFWKGYDKCYAIVEMDQNHEPIQQANGLWFVEQVIGPDEEVVDRANARCEELRQANEHGNHYEVQYMGPIDSK